MGVRYIFNFSKMPPDEAEKLVKRIKDCITLCDSNGQTGICTFFMPSGSPDIFNIPDYCGLRKVTADDPF